MFPNRYFSLRYYHGRYFPPSGTPVAELVVAAFGFAKRKVTALFSRALQKTEFKED
jgi:hypothetical protein